MTDYIERQKIGNSIHQDTIWKEQNNSHYIAANMQYDLLTGEGLDWQVGNPGEGTIQSLSSKLSDCTNGQLIALKEEDSIKLLQTEKTKAAEDILKMYINEIPETTN